jgi:hypothetical protein
MYAFPSLLMTGNYGFFKTVKLGAEKILQSLITPDRKITIQLMKSVEFENDAWCFIRVFLVGGTGERMIVASAASNFNINEDLGM